MPSSSKRKGNQFERRLKIMALAHGLEAERAYASNGLALGEAEECDLVVKYYPLVTTQDGGSVVWVEGDMVRSEETLRVQAKKRESFGNWLWDGLTNVDAFVIGKNRKEPLAILPYEKLLELLK